MGEVIRIHETDDYKNSRFSYDMGFSETDVRRRCLDAQESLCLGQVSQRHISEEKSGYHCFHVCFSKKPWLLSQNGIAPQSRAMHASHVFLVTILLSAATESNTMMNAASKLTNIGVCASSTFLLHSHLQVARTITLADRTEDNRKNSSKNPKVRRKLIAAAVTLRRKEMECENSHRSSKYLKASSPPSTSQAIEFKKKTQQNALTPDNSRKRVYNNSMVQNDEDHFGIYPPTYLQNQIFLDEHYNYETHDRYLPLSSTSYTTTPWDNKKSPSTGEHMTSFEDTSDSVLTTTEDAADDIDIVPSSSEDDYYQNSSFPHNHHRNHKLYPPQTVSNYHSESANPDLNYDYLKKHAQSPTSQFVPLFTIHGDDNFIDYQDDDQDKDDSEVDDDSEGDKRTN